MRYAAAKFPIANYLTRWMEGGLALQLKHEINVESTIIERGTAKRDRDQQAEKLQGVYGIRLPV